MSDGSGENIAMLPCGGPYVDISKSPVSKTNAPEGRDDRHNCAYCQE